MKKSQLKIIIGLRRELHRYPELAMEEEKTRRILKDFLKKHTSLEVADCGKWFYAYYRCGRADAPAVAFRADFDGLPIAETCNLPYRSKHPGRGHQCGHDGHSAALAGLALYLEEEGADCDVYLIFQPGEETGQGGETCAGLLEEKGISAVFAVHNRSGYPRGSIVYREGLTQCASAGLMIAFIGKTAHASQPETGKSPAAAFWRLISFLEQEIPECIRQFQEMALCTLVHAELGEGGRTDFGISPGKATVCVTLRANRESEMQALQQRIADRARDLARMEELKLQFATRDYFPETRNHSEVLALVKEAAKALGKPTIEMEQPWRASEDFGYYTRACPGAMFYVGNGEDYPPLHTGDYDFPDEILPVIVDMNREILRAFQNRR